VPDWLELLLLVFAWCPILLLLHEAGHAFAALALTDGEVSMSLRGGGIERDLRRAGKPERPARPAFIVVLVAIFAFAVWLMPGPALMLLGAFGLALLMQRTEGRR
jgi:hypothetical protein